MFSCDFAPGMLHVVSGKTEEAGETALIKIWGQRGEQQMLLFSMYTM